MVVRIPLLDTAVFSLGVTVTVLLAFRYIEAQYLNIISITVTLIMWIVLTVQIPSNINFVVINAYNLYCVIQAAINWTIMASKNKKEKGIGNRGTFCYCGYILKIGGAFGALPIFFVWYAI